MPISKAALFVLFSILAHLFLRKAKCLLALMSILSQSFFTLVRRHLMSFFLLSAWHSVMFLDGYKCELYVYLISCIKVLAGLNAGMLCSGMMMVVFFEMLRAVFWARFFKMKLPNPRR